MLDQSIFFYHRRCPGQKVYWTTQLRQHGTFEWLSEDVSKNRDVARFVICLGMVAKQTVPPCDMVGDATVVLRENTRRVYATEILDNAVEVAPPARRVHHIRYRLSPSQFQQAPMARTIEHGGICGSHWASTSDHSGSRQVRSCLRSVF